MLFLILISVAVVPVTRCIQRMFLRRDFFQGRSVLFSLQSFTERIRVTSQFSYFFLLFWPIQFSFVWDYIISFRTMNLFHLCVWCEENLIQPYKRVETYSDKHSFPAMVLILDSNLTLCERVIENTKIIQIICCGGCIQMH